MDTPLVAEVLDAVEAATREAQEQLAAGQPLSEITYRVRRRVDAAVQTLVQADMSALQADLEEIAAMELAHVGDAGVPVVAFLWHAMITVSSAVVSTVQWIAWNGPEYQADADGVTDPAGEEAA